ncbi:DUF4348 domain-containing protein [uncultured Tenacibaculum sp.]|uniref:DUF4348 domain-containing protein n=1 Tax=uncultured Tenacibaculum sp. TaxID=174713 RepID=UPI002617FDCA|nr:DUF4348 domain-containing protein [uncultured Tenacibaculum sp.]
MRYIVIFLLLFTSCNNLKSKENKKEIVNLNKSKKEDCIKDFDTFFDKFGKDSVFQKNKIKYPLRYLISDYDYEQEKDTVGVELIRKEENKYFDFTKDKDAINNEFDKYTIEIEKKSDKEILYKHLGYDNGIFIIHKFVFIDGCWFLTEIENKSS